jgi:hypothetical protein
LLVVFFCLAGFNSLFLTLILCVKRDPCFKTSWCCKTRKVVRDKETNEEQVMSSNIAAFFNVEGREGERFEQFEDVSYFLMVTYFLKDILYCVETAFGIILFLLIVGESSVFTLMNVGVMIVAIWTIAMNKNRFTLLSITSLLLLVISFTITVIYAANAPVGKDRYVGIAGAKIALTFIYLIVAIIHNHSGRCSQSCRQSDIVANLGGDISVIPRSFEVIVWVAFSASLGAED